MSSPDALWRQPLVVDDRDVELAEALRVGNHVDSDDLAEGVGVEEADRKALTEALGADKGKLGPRVKGWLGELSIKAAASGGRMGEAAAGGTIAIAIARFLELA